MDTDDDKTRLLSMYTRMYKEHKVNNNFLYMYILLTSPLGYLFWSYFSLFNLINIPFIYDLVINYSLFENVYIFLFASIISDFISGLVHIYLDNSKVNYIETINDYFKIGFQIHHLFPNFQWTCYNKFQPHYEANTIFFSNILISLINVFTYNSLVVYYVLYLTLIMQMNHYWCHALITKKPVPYIVYKLQDFGLLLYYKKHAKHHSTYDNSFCLLSGCCDPIFDYLYNNKYLLNLLIYGVDYILD